ncbi:autotransporter outer membrane beta-barrel domain-containing protein [Cupriavidus basilensis]
MVAPLGTSIYTALGTTALIRAQTVNATLLERLSSNPMKDPASSGSWITAMGSRTKVGGTNSQPGFQSHQYGFLAGIDHPTGESTLGAAAGYMHTNIGEDGTGSSGTTDTLRLALYGNGWYGPVGLAATVGYGLDFLSQKRPFGSIGTAEGDHIGQEFTTAAQASLPLTVGGVVLTPNVGLRYAYFHGNTFSETGANGQNLFVGTDNARSLQPFGAITLDKAFGDTAKPVNVKLRLGYAHEMLAGGRAVTVSALDGTVFAAPGTDLPRSFLTTGASVSLHPSKSLTVAFAFDALLNTGHASAQAASAKLDYRF